MIKSLPTLYSRAATGAIQQWTIQVDGGKWRTEAGQVDGKKTLTEWTVCEPKNVGRANETTDVEQALSEAQARWDKKKKTGYSEDKTKVDTCLKYVEPMLAKDFEEYAKKIDFSKGVCVQNKYNGVRCVATFDGQNVVLKSRKGELWVSVPHVNKDLEKFFAKYPDAVLDGELYNYELRQKLSELVKIVRVSKKEKLTSELLKKSEDMVRFYIYDGYDMTPDHGPNTSYSHRKAWIDANLPKYSKHYRQVPTHVAKSMEEVDARYETFLADGEEGAIIRIVDSPYENKRSKNLLKYKPEDEDDGIVTALHEGTGDWAGAIKMATLKWKGKEFRATFKGTYEQGVERMKNPKSFMNKKVEFLFTGFTSYGVPNYARIDPDNCFKGDR